jgi:hypothetical protein
LVQVPRRFNFGFLRYPLRLLEQNLPPKVRRDRKVAAHRCRSISTSLCSTTFGKVSSYSPDIDLKLIGCSAEYPQIPLNERNPVVNVGNRENPNYLPAEVCQVLPGQTIKRRLSPEQTQVMITFACRKPFENAGSIVGDGKAVLGINPTANSVAVCAFQSGLRLVLIFFIF